MMQELTVESKKVGLTMNTAKTKIMSNHEKTDIIVNNCKIEYVDEYSYLGQIISPVDQMQKEIENRINSGWKRFWSLKEVMKNPEIGIKEKRKVFDSCILPCLTYGCQTWALTNNHVRQLKVCQSKMERSMLSVKLADKMRLETIRKTTKVKDIIHTVRKLKWKWVGHMLRSPIEKWSRKLTMWYPREGKRSRGRPRKRWEDDIKEVAGPLWRRTAMDRRKWRALGEAYAERQADDIT